VTGGVASFLATTGVAIGPAGPTGPVGPAGPAGPTGPAGPALTNRINGSCRGGYV
jgi:hypothetical protein